jgi:hypothetical protein
MGGIARTTGVFRTIVERSPMQNNDESVRYTDRPLTAGDVQPHALVFSRPVYLFETTAGLDLRDGDRFGRREPDETLLADAVWRLRERFTFYAECGMSIDRALALYIGQGYYDCMSEGMPGYEVAIMRMACEVFGVSGDTEVYPGAGRCHTVSDFMRETAGAPDARAAVDRLRLGPLLPQLPCADGLP